MGAVCGGLPTYQETTDKRVVNFDVAPYPSLMIRWYTVFPSAILEKVQTGKAKRKVIRKHSQTLSTTYGAS